MFSENRVIKGIMEFNKRIKENHFYNYNISISFI